MKTLPLAAVLALLMVPGSSARNRNEQQPATGKAPAAAEGKDAKDLKETTAVTHRSVRIDGQPIAYTATAGTLVLRDDGERPIASFFYVFYTRDNVTDLTKRPMVYSFNGGPGTASLWMHLGFTGPRRVVYDEDGFMLEPPYRLSDNDHSILDIADIVYIDPVGTGYSRMAPGEDPHKFHGVTADINAMGDIIRVFTTRYDRWKSPKFVIGESYGTTRAAGVAGYLQSQHQMYLNGVILVSMTNLGVDRGSDLGYATALPYMTATAWYHKKLPSDLQNRPLADAIAESQRFASGDYLLALFKGGELPPEARTSTAKQLSHLTGVPEVFVLQNNLRIEKDRFWKELLRDRGLSMGRLDSRYTGLDKDAAGEHPDQDPALSAWNGPFAATLNTYFRDELKWEADDKYYVWGNVQPWREDPQTHVGDMLRKAMTQNPYLRVLVLAGYYDGGTDFYSAQYTISHLDPSGALNKRLHFAFYESGHMLYLKNSALAKAKQDLARFIHGTQPAPQSTVQ